MLNLATATADEVIQEVRRLAEVSQRVLSDVDRDMVREWAGLGLLERQAMGLDSYRVFLLNACCWLATPREGRDVGTGRMYISRWPRALIMWGEGMEADDVVQA